MKNLYFSAIYANNNNSRPKKHIYNKKFEQNWNKIARLSHDMPGNPTCVPRSLAQCLNTICMKTLNIC